MKKHPATVVVSAVLFLFFIQAAGTLVQSIYILDLMHTSLDAKALGVLFFFAAVLLLPMGLRVPAWLAVTASAGLAAARSVVPFLPTEGRLYASGAALACVMLLLPLVLTPGRDDRAAGARVAAAGLALAVGLSALLRSAGLGIDYSLTVRGAWAAMALAAALVPAVYRLASAPPTDAAPAAAAGERPRSVTLPVIGLFLVIALAWFAFSAPSVISRWTGASYPLVTAAVSVLSLGWVGLELARPGTLRFGRAASAACNALFVVGLAGTLLAARVQFPASPAEGAVVSRGAPVLAQVLLALAVLTFPVLFANARAFFGRIAAAAPTPRRLVPGMLLGSLLLVVLVFLSIFTNVWGYIDPVSSPFRNQYWMPFAVAALGAGLIAVLGRRVDGEPREPGTSTRTATRVAGSAALAAWCAATIVFAVLSDRAPAPTLAGRSSLRVMTYNIQAGNDANAERSYERQAELIRAVAPDVVALQESDTARIGLNNDDYVRRFASTLGYYAWYGPSPVAGTFGTAILSRWPLQNARVSFTFSDTDEVGTAEAEIDVEGRTFTVFNVHPDGSDAAKQAFAESLAARAAGKPHVIALGDFNTRETDPAWPVLASAFTDAWASAWPTRVGPGGIDMRTRIDHVMVSGGLGTRDPVYVLPPESASDHPVHWADVTW